MVKRRAGSPDIDRAQKRKSLAALAMKASSSSLRYEQQGSFLDIFTASGRLKRNSTLSLRSSSRPLLKQAPIEPGLTLAGRSLQTHVDHDVASIKELLLFPTSLAIMKSSWIFRFTVNCTPQLGPPLPRHVEDMLYEKYLGPRMNPRPEALPYIHLGSTALGFRLNFYLVLPYASHAPGHSGTGNMCYTELQAVYDLCIRPALETAYPKRGRWPSWIEAKNESHLKPLKSRRKSTRSEAQEERMHCGGLQTFWDAIEVFCEHQAIAHIMRGKHLVAYGDVDVHDWQSDWQPTWAQFSQLWNDAINPVHVGPGTKLNLEMQLGFDELDILKDFPEIPSRPRTPSARSSLSCDRLPRVPMTPTGPRNCMSVADLYSPPMTAPPRVPLPPVPTLMRAESSISLPKRVSTRRVSSRHSIRCVDPSLTDLSEMNEGE
ncbi:hypothetical protein CB0940_03794 [Cercospora beticola]|uniref:Uncharacterized protein n=1 Tax=Cercospora beticola TaxID=122368 RepID=A0A2G5I233_CERBT|nr:hypothetical protein CB0940_03794 [Cercospora beticola]PIA98864.1 hypothetical protein CB0940_03794 [Cercospora beticola]WPB00989.1 hypothetical protein RHO25_005609 [Cercospora beticola]CAK1360750.1 unnamed protein product [Cercospora beticola]